MGSNEGEVGKPASLLSLRKTGFVASLFRKRGDDWDETAELLRRVAGISAHEGILALEQFTMDLEDEFLRQGVVITVDGTEPELLAEMLDCMIVGAVFRGSEQIRRRKLIAFGVASVLNGYHPRTLKCPQESLVNARDRESVFSIDDFATRLYEEHFAPYHSEREAQWADAPSPGDGYYYDDLDDDEVDDD